MGYGDRRIESYLLAGMTKPVLRDTRCVVNGSLRLYPGFRSWTEVRSEAQAFRREGNRPLPLAPGSCLALASCYFNPDSAIQMSEERTWNSEDTQPCSFKVFLALGMSLHWPNALTHSTYHCCD